MIPRLQDAAADTEIQGLPTTLYLHLIFHLDPHEYRPVKRLSIAQFFERSPRAVTRALKKLAERHYIERGPNRPGEARTYRLVYSRMP